jgi:hypothetical protein
MFRPLIAILSCSLLWFALVAGDDAPETRWWKGNTHTHTLWSDGRAAPEWVAKQYVDGGYDFLVLSDHNTLQSGERWFPVSEDGSSRLSPKELDGLIAAFGEEAVQLRTTEAGREMRLLTLPELRQRFEVPGEFLFIQGEEVTSHFRSTGEKPVNYPVHINAVNIEAYIAPRGGESVSDLLNKSLEAIIAHGEESGRPVLAHLNHPNFGWGVTWQDVARMGADRFFEVYNGHRGVRSHGDETHPSTESIWDQALTLRLTALGLGPLFGVATDDAHDYYGGLTSQSGRGWIMVRSANLDGDSIVRAMQAGEFYASSGVTLDDVQKGNDAYRVVIRAQEGVTFVTRFVGTRIIDGTLGSVGEVLAEQEGLSAVYEPKGDELYVRAVVTSSRVHPNPYAKGDREMAWGQPWVRRP